jgi:hypothetical protein
MFAREMEAMHLNHTALSPVRSIRTVIEHGRSPFYDDRKAEQRDWSSVGEACQIG